MLLALLRAEWGQCRGDPNQYTTLQGENLTNTTYASPWIAHVWQPFTTTS
jgi:hypothetical protein